MLAGRPESEAPTEMTLCLLCLLVEADASSAVVGQVKGVPGVYAAETIPGTRLITVNVATQERDIGARIAELPGVTVVSVGSGLWIRKKGAQSSGS